LRPAKRAGCFSSAARPGGAGAFDHGLLDLQQHHDGLLDVAFVDQHQVVDALGDQLARQPPAAHRDAFGDGAGALRMLRALDGVEHGREALGLHADDVAGPASARAPRWRCPLIRPPPPTAITSVSGRAAARSISRPIVPWPAMTSGSSNGCTKLRPCSAASQRMVARGVEGLAVQHHLGAEAARALDLHRGRELRHHDHRAQAQALRVVRHALRVVAGRGGDHAASARPASRSPPAPAACSARRAP
jgi:hypothetical protein